MATDADVYRLENKMPMAMHDAANEISSNLDTISRYQIHDTVFGTYSYHCHLFTFCAVNFLTILVANHTISQ